MDHYVGYLEYLFKKIIDKKTSLIIRLFYVIISILIILSALSAIVLMVLPHI